MNPTCVSKAFILYNIYQKTCCYLIFGFRSALLFKIFKNLCNKNSVKSLFYALLFKMGLYYLRRASLKSLQYLNFFLNPYGEFMLKMDCSVHVYDQWQIFLPNHTFENLQVYMHYVRSTFNLIHYFKCIKGSSTITIPEYCQENIVSH